MASKRRLARLRERKHEGKACRRKMSFETVESAEEQIERLKASPDFRKHEGELFPYKCRYCGGYHFGHIQTDAERRAYEKLKGRKLAGTPPMLQHASD